MRRRLTVQAKKFRSFRKKHTLKIRRFLEQRLTFRFLTTARVHFGPKIFTWLTPLFSWVTPKKIGLFDLHILVVQLRNLLTAVFSVSTLKFSVIAHSPRVSQKILVGVSYILNRPSPGLLSNFKKLIKRLRLLRKYRKFLKKPQSQVLKLVTARLVRTKKYHRYPVIAIDMGPINHWFINESRKVGLRTYINFSHEYDSRLYHVPMIAFGLNKIAMDTLAYLIRDTVQHAWLLDRYYFIKFIRYKNPKKIRQRRPKKVSLKQKN